MFLNTATLKFGCQPLPILLSTPNPAAGHTAPPRTGWLLTPRQMRAKQRAPTPSHPHPSIPYASRALYSQPDTPPSHHHDAPHASTNATLTGCQNAISYITCPPPAPARAYIYNTAAYRTRAPPSLDASLPTSPPPAPQPVHGNRPGGSAPVLNMSHAASKRVTLILNTRLSQSRAHLQTPPPPARLTSIVFTNGG